MFPELAPSRSLGSGSRRVAAGARGSVSTQEVGWICCLVRCNIEPYRPSIAAVWCYVLECSFLECSILLKESRYLRENLCYGPRRHCTPAAPKSTWIYLEIDMTPWHSYSFWSNEPRVFLKRSCAENGISDCVIRRLASDECTTRHRYPAKAEARLVCPRLIVFILEQLCHACRRIASGSIGRRQ